MSNIFQNKNQYNKEETSKFTDRNNYNNINIMQKKFELSPIKSESSNTTEKLLDDNENSSIENTSLEVKKFKIHAKNFSLKKNQEEEEYISFKNAHKNQSNSYKTIKNNNKKGEFENEDKNFMSKNDLESIKLSRIKRNENLRNVLGYSPFLENKKEITFSSNTYKLLKKSLPLMVSILAETLEINISLIIFSNYYNDIRLISALGLVNLYIMFMITPFIIPLEQTLVMLGSTALAANKIKILSNLFLKSQFFSIFLCFLFIIINYFLFKPLLQILNFEAPLIEQCYDYFINMIPFVILDKILFLNFGFMNILKTLKYIYWINLIKLITHFIACCYFIIYLNLSIYGIAYSFTTTYAIAIVFSLFFFQSLKQDFKDKGIFEIKFEINYKIFIGLKPFIKIAMMNIFLMISDIWADEILNFFASKLSYDEFSVYSMVFEHLSLFFSIEIGIGFSASLIISKFLGKLKDNSNISIEDLKRIIKYTLIFITCFYFFMYFSVYCLSKYNSQFYFSEQKYQESFASNLKYFAFVSYFQAIFLMLQEIMVNLKNQSTALYNSIIIGYGMKISIAYILMFVYNYQLLGLYIAVFISSNFGIIFGLNSILNTDYTELEKEINNYLELEEDKLDEEIENELDK